MKKTVNILAKINIYWTIIVSALAALAVLIQPGSWRVMWLQLILITSFPFLFFGVSSLFSLKKESLLMTSAIVAVFFLLLLLISLGSLLFFDDSFDKVPYIISAYGLFVLFGVSDLYRKLIAVNLIALLFMVLNIGLTMMLIGGGGDLH